MNQIENMKQEIVTVDITEGDYNNVYKRGPIVRGTWKQIEEYVKSYFTEEGLKRAEEIPLAEGYGLQVYEQLVNEDGSDVDRDDEGLDDDQVPVIEYYVTADLVDEGNEIDDEVIDLTKGD